MHSIVAAAAAPAGIASCAGSRIAPGPLLPDPNGRLDLPRDFELTVVSRAGDTMSDGLVVPAAHDGMAAFPAPDGRVVLVCNHEIEAGFVEYGAFGTDYASVPAAVKERLFDRGHGRTPGAGGTTTTIYNPATRAVERQFLSLAGTENNCAGGATPWGSWLSCEESFGAPGTTMILGREARREQRHGYVFEVPAAATGLVEPVPLRAMGRFEHEAAAVDPATGIVYLTEDRYHGLFYRFLPDVDGKLHEGGRLQALAISGRPSARTHNWGDTRDIRAGDRLRTRWIDLDDVDPATNDLRQRGTAAGAAMFARGEGLCVADGELVFSCTEGGPARRGQIFRYTPSRYEGTEREKASPGRLQLLAEAAAGTLLQNADNITMAPWGDLIVCEDTFDHCGLVGIRPDGSQYALADNAYSTSELAGACFSPDGSILFVNIQYPGMTVAITGPWPT